MTNNSGVAFSLLFSIFYVCMLICVFVDVLGAGLNLFEGDIKGYNPKVCACICLYIRFYTMTIYNIELCLNTLEKYVFISEHKKVDEYDFISLLEYMVCDFAWINNNNVFLVKLGL